MVDKRTCWAEKAAATDDKCGEAGDQCQLGKECGKHAVGYKKNVEKKGCFKDGYNTCFNEQ
jgi:hypothetical protein